MIEQRFFKVIVKQVVCTTVQVAAATSEQAVQAAMIRVPAVGRAWQVKSTKAEIMTVARTAEALGEPLEEDHGNHH